MMEAPRTTVASSTLRYFIGVVLVRTVSFLMLPVYTRSSGRASGLLQLFQITTDVVGIAISAGTTSGVMRLYHKAPSPRDAHSVAFTALLLLALLNGTGAAILMLFAKPIATLVSAAPTSPFSCASPPSPSLSTRSSRHRWRTWWRIAR